MTIYILKYNCTKKTKDKKITNIIYSEDYKKYVYNTNV